jgi:endonuclease G
MKRRVYFLCALTIGLISSLELAYAEVIQRDFDGFSIWIDCERDGAIRFEYTVVADNGSLDRLPTFTIDAGLPTGCGQTSSATYSGAPAGYDRGHLVPANHLDHLEDGIRQSNIMTNILPQAKNMNRGAWLKTEEIIECYRDLKNLRVVGGVIWGFNPHDDYFLGTHSVATPDYFWKVIISADDVIAWIVPNSQEATRGMLDRYLVSIEQLEEATNENFGLPEYLRKKRHANSWPTPSGCDLG